MSSDEKKAALYLKQMGKLFSSDSKKNNSILHLTANENRMSNTVRNCLLSGLGDRYYLEPYEEYGEGVARKGSLLLKGLPGVHEAEKLAFAISQKLFSAAMCDFRPISGVHGMISILATATEPGDLIFSLHPEDGGHFATTTIARCIGRRLKHMRLSARDLLFDLEHLKSMVKEEKPKAIFFDHGMTLYPFPLEEIREMLGNEVLMIFDASHTLGLIAGKAFQNPLEQGCDILQGNTHKTFPGPQKAMILFRDFKKGQELSIAIGKGLISSQQTHHSMALYLTLAEMDCFSFDYANQIVNNAQRLSQFLEKNGLKVLKNHLGHTQTHIVLIEMESQEESYQLCSRLHHCHISTNACSGYGRSLVRIGLQEVTRRGMKEPEMERIAQFIKGVRTHEKEANVRRGIMKLLKEFPSIQYSFDTIG